MYQLTTTTKKLARQRKRIRFVAGGTSAGKTISILQLLIDDAQTDTTPTLTSVVAESFPHLRRGAMRDFKAMMTQHGYWQEKRWSETTKTYTFESGSSLEFFSADQPDKVRGPRRDRLFMNEANNIPYEAWDQLLVRTREYAWADWNPTNEFWAYTDVMPNRSDFNFLTVTYKDNEGLDQNIIDDIEAHRYNKQWWQVYGLGQLGEVEGRIFKDWNLTLDEVPHNARLEYRGLDFGYAADPAALVDIYYYDGGYILDEQFYRKGMANKDIADRLNVLPHSQTLTIADSAEQKSIDEIASYGCNIIGVTKRPGYVRRTSENSLISWVQSQRVSVTKRSTNLIKSYRNFMWQTDKDGNILDEYDHFWSDGMMASIYGLSPYQMRGRQEQQRNVQNYSTGNMDALIY